MSEPADRDGPASALERFVLESGDLLRSLVADDEVVAEIEADGRLLGLWSPNRDLPPGSALELVGRSLDDLIGPEEGPDVLAAVRRVLLTGESETVEYRTVIGGREQRWSSHITTAPAASGSGRSVLFLGREITERVAAERELGKAEARYRTLVEQLPAITYVEYPHSDPSLTRFAYVSPQVERLLGYTAEEIQAAPDGYLRHIYEEDLPRVVQENARTEETGEPFDAEYRVRAKDGRLVWLHSTAVLVRDDEGEPSFWHGIALDVTREREASEALRESEERFRMVVEHAWDLIRLVDPDGMVVYASPSHEAVLGYPPEDIVGGSAFRDVPPETLDYSLASFADALEGKTVPFVRFQLRHRDGRLVDMEGSGWRPILDETGKVTMVLTISRDVTELLRAERERAGLIAQIVAGHEDERAKIAQDLHDDPVQVMTAVGLHVAALSATRDDPVARDQLAKIGELVERAISRLRGLMFRLWPPSLESVGLAAAIEEYLLRELRDDVAWRVDSTLEEEPPLELRIVAYRVAQEALANVKEHARASEVVVTIEPAEGGVSVTIRDDGIGFSEAGDSPAGHMGLRSMRQRAELARGRFEIGPGDGGGTVVSLWLPETGEVSP